MKLLAKKNKIENLVSATLGIWIDSVLLPGKRFYRPIAEGFGEVLIQYDDFSKHCLEMFLKDFDECDPVIYGGVIWKIDSGCFGTSENMVYNFVEEWDASRTRGKAFHISNDKKIIVDHFNDVVKITENWGNTRCIYMNKHQYVQEIEKLQKIRKSFRDTFLRKAIDTYPQKVKAVQWAMDNRQTLD